MRDTQGLGSDILESGARLRLGGLQIPVLVSGIEARAGLHGVEHVVAHDQSLRVLRMQLFQQLAQGALLGFGAGVGGTAFSVQAAFVADAYRVAVAVQAVGADHLNGTARLDCSVAAHNEVVAATFPTVVAMPAVDVLNRALLPRTHCGAMKND